MDTKTLTKVRIAVAFSVLALVGCSPPPKELPPPAVPAQKVPRLPVEPGPQPPDRGRVLLDTVEGHARVVEVVEDARASAFVGGGYGFAEAQTTRPICTTPCAADLPYGSHRLRFTAPTTKAGFDQSHESDVTFGQSPSVYRVALRAEKDPKPIAAVAANVLMIFGGSAALAGGAALGAASGMHSENAPEYRAVGGAVLGIGAALFFTGLAIEYSNRGAVREARETQFPLPARAAGDGLAGRAQ